MRRLLGAIGTAICLVSACVGGGTEGADVIPTASPSPTITLAVRVRGEGDVPLAGVQVVAGETEVTTGEDGRFELAGLAEGTTLTLTHCAYQSATFVALTDYQLKSVTLLPLPVSGALKSNLSHKGITGSVGGAAQARTDKKGRFQVAGVCPGDELILSAKGYKKARAMVDESRSLDVELEAHPKTTYEQLVAWVAAQLWAKSCALLHPDTRAYISEKQCIRVLRTAANDGYQTVSIKVHSVTYIKWTHPACTVSQFGPKTYKGTAAMNHTTQQATPSGGVRPLKGIAHFVQTKDGLWRWFITGGCTVPLP